MVLGVLVYLLTVISAFAAGMAPRGFGQDGSAFPGLLVLVLGLIPLALWVLLLRVGLETSVANVRTAMDVRALRERA